MFADDNKNSVKYGFVLNLNKSLYGIFQAPCSWYKHLQKGLETIDFNTSKLYLGIYYGCEMILIRYVDDTLLFGPDLQEIEKVISELDQYEYALTS